MTLTWTDSNLSADKTLIRKVHIDELRAGVDATDTTVKAHTLGTNYSAHPLATATHAGLMSPEEFSTVVARDADTVDGYHAADLIDMVQNAWPIGAVIAFSGALNSIPSGWHLCDGTAGTPDLRDKFIVGSGGTYSGTDVGGSKTTTLSVSQMPAHRHVDPYGERYTDINGFDAVSGTSNCMGSGDSDHDNHLLYSGYEGGSAYSDSIMHRTLPSTQCEAHNNMPPYRALYWIMRVTGNMPTSVGSTGTNAITLSGHSYEDIIALIAASTAAPTYKEVQYTKPGTYVWTAPVGVTRVKVALVGGGGGIWYTDTATSGGDGDGVGSGGA